MIVAVSVARDSVGYKTILKHSEERRAVTDPIPDGMPVMCVLLSPDPCSISSIREAQTEVIRGCE